MQEIQENTSQTALKLVNKGLTKAAETLSFFMCEQMKYDDSTLNFKMTPVPPVITTKKGNDLVVLVTEIIGSLKGVCLLVFTNEEADILRKKALPEEIRNNPDLFKEMKDGILLEIDNIISASVITQFSNILKQKMYGGVPNLHIMNNTEINNYLQKRLSEQLMSISFNTHFSSDNINFSPQFIWLFDESFSKSIGIIASGD